MDSDLNPELFYSDRSLFWIMHSSQVERACGLGAAAAGCRGSDLAALQLQSATGEWRLRSVRAESRDQSTHSQ